MHDCCFRGGASYGTLLRKGNGMRNKFGTPNALRADGSHDIGADSVATLLAAPWDTVVMNDYTQADILPPNVAHTCGGSLPNHQPNAAPTHPGSTCDAGSSARRAARLSGTGKGGAGAS